jgi:hypothetical protein
MNNSYPQLERRLAEALRAWRRSSWQRGLSLALFGLLAILAFVYFVEPTRLFWWWTALAGLTAVWLAMLVKFLFLPLRVQPTLAQVARFLEEQHPELEDRLATAVEFGESRKTENQNWLDRMIRDAIAHTAGINFSQQLQPQFARGWQVLAWGALIVFLFALLNYSKSFQSRVAGYLAASQETHQTVARLQLTPGDAKVARGETVEINVVSPQLDLAQATLYLENRRDSWQPNTMSLATQPGHFTHKIFDIRDTLRYYVRAGDELSAVYTLIPLDAPEVKSFRMTYRYPAGMGLTPKSESGSGDVYAPAGTTVDLEVVATQPLQRAEIRFGDAAFQSMAVASDTVARHKFLIEKDSYYVLRLTNPDNLNNLPIEYFIHATPDHAPQITILRPGRDLRPTMLEEVNLEVAVREDYGLRQLDFIYARNNGEPARQNLLPDLTRAASNEFVVNTFLYLEDLGAQPGDFISYYFEASDAAQQTSSDLYFLEVRPFEEEFYRALSQGSGGSSPAASLALSQKEIITATWKLEQMRKQISAEEVQSGSKALAETQQGLSESIQQMAGHAKLRARFVEDAAAGNLVQYLEQATAAMREAVPLLEDAKLKEALDPERRAYHFLLQAEAEIRRRELSQSSSASDSYSQLQSRDELQRLFKDELEKIQSKYETFENNRQQQRDAQMNEAQEKVRELAQRQERLVDLNRRLARENMSEENRRQIERLRREQEQINRDLQQLSRRMQQSGDNPANANNETTQQALRQAIEEMQRASDSLRRNSPSQAAAEGNRALDRLNRLTEQLQREQTGSLREQLTQIQNDLQQLGDAQSQLSEQLPGAEKPLTGDKSADQAQTQRWQEQQDDLRRRTERVQEKLRQAQAATRSRQEEKEIARDLTNALREMDNRKIAQRMNEAGRAIEQKDWPQARQQQKDATQGLRRAEAALHESLSRLAETPEEKLNTALQEAHRLREQLEESLQQARNEPGSSQDQNRDPSSSASEKGSATSNAPGAPGEGGSSNETLTPENMDWWNENLWGGMRELEQLQPFMQDDSALGRNYHALLKGYRGVLQSFRGGNPLRLENIESRLLDPLRRLEAELATRLATLQQQERMLSVRDEQVPPQYREMVEEYFKRLARKK